MTAEKSLSDLFSSENIENKIAPSLATITYPLNNDIINAIITTSFIAHL